MRSLQTVDVWLVPELADPDRLAGGLVVVVDVLRATTTMAVALAAGCREILVAAEIDEAIQIAERLPREQRLLVGERGGVRPEGFDLGNSPFEFTKELCHNKTLVWTTSNGTRAILAASAAARVRLGAFVNFSAVCEEVLAWDLPVHILCAGAEGEIALEDVLFAGALVEFLVERGRTSLSDAARIAWDAYEHHGEVLISALELSRGGKLLERLGMEEDVKAAAAVDTCWLVPEVRYDPPRVMMGAVYPAARHFNGDTGLWI